MKLQEIYQKLKAFISIGGFPTQKKRDLDEFLNHMQDDFVFCIVGKTGSGKSTLINSVFKPETSQNVNHGMSTQTKPEKIEIKLDKERGYITLVDMPGLCEDVSTKDTIWKYYDDNLSSADVILWLNKVDDPALECDQQYYNKLDENIKNKIIFGVSQLEKGGGGEWNTKENKPSKAQLKGILNKIRTLQSKFNIQEDELENKVVCFSCIKNFNIDKLLYVLSIHTKKAAKLGLKLNPELV